MFYVIFLILCVYIITGIIRNIIDIYKFFTEDMKKPDRKKLFE